MEDADAFRLPRRKIELAGREFDSDSSSDVSRNLNDELREMEEHGHGLRRASFGSVGGRSEIPSRSETPSEYPMSPLVDGRCSSLPMSPRAPSPISRCVSAYAI